MKCNLYLYLMCLAVGHQNYQNGFFAEFFKAATSIYRTPFGSCLESYFQLQLPVHYKKYFNSFKSSVKDIVVFARSSFMYMQILSV